MAVANGSGCHNGEYADARARTAHLISDSAWGWRRHDGGFEKGCPGHSKMRVLYVTAHVPHAQAYGAQQRVLGIARLLARFGKVSMVLAVPESWNIDPEAIEKTRQEFDVLAVLRMRYLRRAGIVHRVRHDLDATYRHVYDFMAAPADTRIVMRLMREHNLTWIHTDQLATSLGISISEDTVLDAHDLPSRRYASSIALDTSLG